eukprot:6178803-Pleurochrysis_carterae.AAC.3
MRCLKRRRASSCGRISSAICTTGSLRKGQQPRQRECVRLRLCVRECEAPALCSMHRRAGVAAAAGA